MSVNISVTAAAAAVLNYSVVNIETVGREGTLGAFSRSVCEKVPMIFNECS